MRLDAHDLMPMFTVTNAADRTSFAFERIWQRRNLLLVSIPAGAAGASTYVEQLVRRAADLRSLEAELVITADIVPGVPSPGVVVADRWGEIYFIAEADRPSNLPAADDLVDWVRFVQLQCPECQGEAR